MRRVLFLFVLLLTRPISAEDLDLFDDLEASKEHVLDKRQNYFLTSTDYRIAPKVNPITGEYCEEELDLVVAGSQPLSVRRFYNSHSPYDPRYATWRYNPESYFVANMEWGGQEIFAAIGDADGSVCSLKRSSSVAYAFDYALPKSFAISNATGQTHPLNTQINYYRFGDPKDKKRFQYMGTITDGSGRQRFFASPMHRWTNVVHWTKKKHGFGWGSEKEYSIHPNVWTPYHVPIVEEKLPNGNILCYTYTPWKEEKQNFPLPKLLGSITAYNSDKSKILGSIHFHYPRAKNEEVSGIQATGSDGRSAFMQHTGTSPIKLSAAHRPGQPLVSYGSHDTTLNTVARPEGRVMTTEYHADGKVAAQYASVGPNGEMYPIGRYAYHDKLTIVYDAQNNKTHYHYDDHKKITTIETYQGDTLYRTDRFTWDPATGNLLCKTIEDSAHLPLQITEYQYDKNQNPILEKMGDGKQWRTLKRTFSDDGFNLKLTETDREGKSIHYSYLPGTNLLSSILVYENSTIRQRTFHTYDNCAICIKTLHDDGTHLDPQNLQDLTYRKITHITPKQTLPCFGLPEIVEEKTIDPSGQEILLHKTHFTYTPSGKILQEEHYDAHDNHHHTLTNTYNDQELLISTTDPLGNTTYFTYDANHNLLSISGPKLGQYKEIAYDKANRPTRIADWQIDGQGTSSFADGLSESGDSHRRGILILEKKYDKLGRLIEEIDACKNSTHFDYDALGRITTIRHPDEAVEKREYNLLGQITQETDPLGYVTTKTYNPFGQPTTIHYPDGSEEHFTYNPTGTINSHTDKNGCTILYKYDLFDQPIEETYLSNNQVLKTLKSTYTPFCKLSETDGEGNTTYYTYDFSGRKTSQITDTQKTHYSYDPFGLVEKTDYEDFHQITHHDLAARLLTKTLASDITQFQERYAYDEASNLTHRITSHGAFETHYNTLGKPLLETNPLGHSTEHAYHFDNHYSHTTIDAHHIQTTRLHDNRGREITCTTTSQGETLAKNGSHYDLNGNLTSLTHYVFRGLELIKTLTHHWEYGPLGRLERFIEAAEKQTQYLYDEKGRLKTLIKPSGISLHHEYDPLGRLTRYFSSDFDYHYTYDRNDRLLFVYDSLSKMTTTRTYDALGNIVQEVIGTGLTFSNAFDSQGRRIQLLLPDQSTIHYTYHGAFLHHITRKEHTFTYTTRDLEGCPLKLELPALGTISITRDPLSRICTFTSSAYTSLFPQDAYDPVGNLLHYQYKDPLGSIDCTYTYDPLNQLTSEHEHTYLFDSIHNRLQKDSSPHTVNDYCQILSDGNTRYDYDLDGNLIFDATWRYTYDTQDRLVTLENNQERIEYTYDPFHRRLSKTASKNGWRTQNIRYLWDGDNEIGAVDEGKITQLRVLAEGLGAEIGAAVLYELNSKTYVPIHDHNGSLAVLIDTKTQKPLETYRYTAFGEALTTATLSPWRFSSKRIEETGLIFFGRRYYLPTLGRWITQDPQGFDDGPNLYAYLNNCPLIRIDPYGLSGIDNWWSLQDDYMGLTRRTIGNFFGIGLPKDYRSFEDPFSNKSRCYSLNHDFGFNFPEPSIGAYLFGNGACNTFDDLGEKAHRISTYSGYNTRGVYNATHSPLIDGHEAIMNWHSHTMTPPVYLYHQEWNRYFDKDTTGAPLWQGCHSQGAPQVRNALEEYPKERRDRIIVAAFAPFAYISKDLCMSVTHYVCPSDPVPFGDRKARLAHEDTIIYVPRMRTCKQSCHEFLNPIYLPYIQKEISKYQGILNNYVR